MRKTPEKQRRSDTKRIAVVASRFNEFITQRLLKACLAELAVCGVAQKFIKTVWVPGAFEIPLAALRLAKKKDVAAVICLGAVIRGETFHFELIAQNCAGGITEVALKTGKPVVFGVLTTNNTKQAYQRSQPKGENKGKDAARCAIDMINLNHSF